MPGGGDVGTASVEEAMGNARDWIGEHLVVILAVGAIALVLVVTIIAIVLWINSRGVFMYADNVASGRFDVVRPWREHADRAWSYFGWSFGASMIGGFGALALVVPGIFLAVALFTQGASAGPILGIVGLVLLFVVWVIALSLFSILLRDFAAPLQIKLDVPCGKALGVAWKPGCAATSAPSSSTCCSRSSSASSSSSAPCSPAASPAASASCR